MNAYDKVNVNVHKIQSNNLYVLFLIIIRQQKYMLMEKETIFFFVRV